MQDVKGQAGVAQTRAYVQGPHLAVSGDAFVDVKPDGFEAMVQLDVSAHLVKAGAAVTQGYNLKVNGENVTIRATVGADCKVGAQGRVAMGVMMQDGKAGVVFEPKGFVGARCGISTKAQVYINDPAKQKPVAEVESALVFLAGAAADAGFQVRSNGFKVWGHAAVGAGAGFELKASWRGGRWGRAGEPGGNPPCHASRAVMKLSWKWRSGLERLRVGFSRPSRRGGESPRAFGHDERVAAQGHRDGGMPTGEAAAFVESAALSCSLPRLPLTSSVDELAPWQFKVGKRLDLA